MTALRPFGTRHPRMFDEFRREIDSLMNRFFEEGAPGEVPEWYTPLIELAETDQTYEVSLDLPGMKLEDFDVELKHGDLWISGQRKRPETEGKTYHRSERPYGQFRRAVRLGEDVDPEKVEAEYKDGVLTITVPKAESAATKHIEVKG